MERYQVVLAYDGTDFHGSQVQNGTRTVQGVVEETLRKLNWQGKSVLIAGRTDAGVHASGQVMAFDLAWDHSPADLGNALNALLPQDVAVSQISVSCPDFHPRFSARARRYRYRIFCQPSRDPLRERYAWRVWPAPDLDVLQAAAEAFIGVHDFAGFGRATRPGGSTIRNVMVANWLLAPNRLHPDETCFEVSANAFLYHMVRRLVFVQVALGQGKLGMDELLQHLHSPRPDPIQGLAPPHGLSLVEVCYPTVQGENTTQ